VRVARTRSSVATKAPQRIDKAGPKRGTLPRKLMGPEQGATTRSPRSAASSTPRRAPRANGARAE
jgi:hypothetical protein